MKKLIPPNLEVDKMIGLLALEESSTTRIEIIYLDCILSFGQHYDTISNTCILYIQHVKYRGEYRY